ncbi:MAG: GFA family protein [Halioglobus sp.]|nr:GFA family protein [Halioglobus sp.]
MAGKEKLIGSCLCGAVAYQSHQAHEQMWNCHCVNCRKASGVAFATWIKSAPAGFKWLRGGSAVASYDSSPALRRAFCARCGSVLPAHHLAGDYMMLPAGGIATAHGLTPAADLYNASAGTWYDDDTPCRQADLEADLRRCRHTGSCLCGAVTYTVTGQTDAIRACHCSRCRRRCGAGFFTGMPVLISDFQLRGDTGALTSFALPDTQYYRYRFCRGCGTILPGALPGTDRAVIAAGTLDSPPPVRLLYHIYCADRAPWVTLPAAQPCFDGRPPSDFDWRKTCAAPP